MGIFRRDPMKAVEAEIASLTTRRDGVMKRLVDATAMLNAAAAEQRRLLIESDSTDATTLKKAGDACRKAQDTKEALEDAARVLAEMIAEAEAKVAADRERVERERLVRAVEDRAAALAACIAAEEQAVQALAQAHQATRLAAFAAFPGVAAPGADADSLIGEVKAVALHVAYPMEYSSAPFSRSLSAPCATLGQAASTYLASLRARAEAIRTGTTPLSLPTVAEAA